MISQLPHNHQLVPETLRRCLCSSPALVTTRHRIVCNFSQSFYYIYIYIQYNIYSIYIYITTKFIQPRAQPIYPSYCTRRTSHEYSLQFNQQEQSSTIICQYIYISRRFRQEQVYISMSVHGKELPFTERRQNHSFTSNPLSARGSQPPSLTLCWTYPMYQVSPCSYIKRHMYHAHSTNKHYVPLK